MVGRGVLDGETVELVAHGRRLGRHAIGGREQYCMWVEFLPRENIPLGCRAATEPLSGGALEIESRLRTVSPRSVRATEVGGSLSSQVASVVVTFQRQAGKPIRADVLVAKVRGRLQKRLRQSRPFGYFYASIHGLFPLRSARVKAYDSDGRLIGLESG